MNRIAIELPRAHVPMLIHFLIEVENISIELPQTGIMPTSDADADLSVLEVILAAFAGGTGASIGKATMEAIIEKVAAAYKEGANISSVSTESEKVLVDEATEEELRAKLKTLLADDKNALR